MQKFQAPFFSTLPAREEWIPLPGAKYSGVFHILQDRISFLHDKQFYADLFLTKCKIVDMILQFYSPAGFLKTPAEFWNPKKEVLSWKKEVWIGAVWALDTSPPTSGL